MRCTDGRNRTAAWNPGIMRSQLQMSSGVWDKFNQTFWRRGMDRFFFPTETRMSKPRHLGPSPSLNRSLSRLSSSSSFSSRQSNSRIHKFLIAGGLLLFATVAFFQVHLPGAPQGSKLSPLEHGKSGLYHYWLSISSVDSLSSIFYFCFLTCTF